MLIKVQVHKADYFKAYHAKETLFGHARRWFFEATGAKKRWLSFVASGLDFWLQIGVVTIVYKNCFGEMVSCHPAATKKDAVGALKKGQGRFLVQ